MLFSMIKWSPHLLRNCISGHIKRLCFVKCLAVNLLIFRVILLKLLSLLLAQDARSHTYISLPTTSRWVSRKGLHKKCRYMVNSHRSSQYWFQTSCSSNWSSISPSYLPFSFSGFLCYMNCIVYISFKIQFVNDILYIFTWFILHVHFSSKVNTCASKFQSFRLEQSQLGPSIISVRTTLSIQAGQPGKEQTRVINSTSQIVNRIMHWTSSLEDSASMQRSQSYAAQNVSWVSMK